MVLWCGDIPLWNMVSGNDKHVVLRPPLESPPGWRNNPCLVVVLPKMIWVHRLYTPNTHHTILMWQIKRSPLFGWVAHWVSFQSSVHLWCTSGVPIALLVILRTISIASFYFITTSLYIYSRRIKYYWRVNEKHCLIHHLNFTSPWGDNTNIN